MVNVYIQLTLYWVIYFIIHSIFASIWVKDLFRRHLPVLFRYYRLIYVAFSFLLLVPILLAEFLRPTEYIFERSNFTTITGLILAVNGLLIFYISLKLYDLTAFLGLDYNKESDENILPLKTDGLLRYSRHPLYASSIMIIIGYILINPTISTLVSAFMLILYFIVGIQFEERKLIREYSDTYRKYMKETPMLFPGIKFLTNLR